MSGESPSIEVKIPRFVYTSTLFDYKPESNSQLLSPDYTPASSIDSTQGKVFGNSARFYKALKDYQQSSDPNILKEELWASRKEITNLEKLLLERTEEILELKKSGPVDITKSELMKKSLESEKHTRKLLENENLRLKHKIEEFSSQASDTRSLIKTKNLFQYTLKKLIYDNEDFFSKVLNKLKEQEFRIRKLKSVLDKKDLKKESVETLIKQKMSEILELKKEMNRINRLTERRVLENEEKNRAIAEKVEELQTKNECLVSKLRASTTEAKLLSEISEELEKENLSALGIIDEKRARIKKLRKKLMKSFSVIKNLRISQVKNKDSQKLYEKYKNYKRKLKNFMKSAEKSAKAEINVKGDETKLMKEEISRLNEQINLKDLKIIELQSEIHVRDMEIVSMSQEIEAIKSVSKGVSSEKYEKVVSDLNQLKEDYEKLLRSYSENQEDSENNFNLVTRCAELEEKVVDLESSHVINSAKLQKYKEILMANGLATSHSRSNSESKSSISDS